MERNTWPPQSRSNQVRQLLSSHEGYILRHLRNRPRLRHRSSPPHHSSPSHVRHRRQRRPGDQAGPENSLGIRHRHRPPIVLARRPVHRVLPAEELMFGCPCHPSSQPAEFPSDLEPASSASTAWRLGIAAHQARQLPILGAVDSPNCLFPLVPTVHSPAIGPGGV